MELNGDNNKEILKNKVYIYIYYIDITKLLINGQNNVENNKIF